MKIQATFLSLIAASLLTACSPEYNWRDYASPDAPYRVMFPAKPATHTREIDLDGLKVKMTMAAVEIEGVMFAVGAAEAPDATQAQIAVTKMKTALVQNIGAAVTSEKANAGAIDIEARGVSNGQNMRLVGHFEARGKRFYQVVVMGRASAMPQEQVEQFLTSFKLQ